MPKQLASLIQEIKAIIENKLMIDPSQIKDNENLHDSLGIDPEIDLPLIISALKSHYQLSNETTNLLMQTTTLKQLANIILEETELG